MTIATSGSASAAASLYYISQLNELEKCKKFKGPPRWPFKLFTEET